MKEAETTEFKKSLAELKQGLISLVAMLNKHGAAELWFGVSPDGKPTGLDLNDKTLRDVSQAIAAHIDPRIYSDRVEIHNPGGLYDDLRRGMPLILENAPSVTFREAAGLFIASFQRPTALTTLEAPRKHHENTKKFPESVKETLLRHLRRLQAENKLRRVGPDKGGRWEIVD
jgi:predicted HTH transcriptional regulator